MNHAHDKWPFAKAKSVVLVLVAAFPQVEMQVSVAGPIVGVGVDVQASGLPQIEESTDTQKDEHTAY